MCGRAEESERPDSQHRRRAKHQCWESEPAENRARDTYRPIPLGSTKSRVNGVWVSCVSYVSIRLSLTKCAASMKTPRSLHSALLILHLIVFTLKLRRITLIIPALPILILRLGPLALALALTARIKVIVLLLVILLVLQLSLGLL
jgi:hypothetical protein